MPARGRRWKWCISTLGSSGVSRISPPAAISLNCPPVSGTSAAVVAGPGRAEKTGVGGLSRPPMPSSRSIRLIGPVRAGDPPVALPHVAYQDRVPLPVHRIHLGEVGLADHGLSRAHQRSGIGVALGGVAVALRHQVGGREQRQLLEAPVPAEGLEVEGEAPVTALGEQRQKRELEPGGVLMAFAREIGRHFETLVLLRDQHVDLRGADVLDTLHEPTQILVDDRGTHAAQEDRRVIQDVAHSVHGVAEQRDAGAAQLGHGLRGQGPVGEGRRPGLRSANRL